MVAHLAQHKQPATAVLQCLSRRPSSATMTMTIRYRTHPCSLFAWESSDPVRDTKDLLYAYNYGAGPVPCRRFEPNLDPVADANIKQGIESGGPLTISPCVHRGTVCLN